MHLQVCRSSSARLSHISGGRHILANAQICTELLMRPRENYYNTTMGGCKVQERTKYDGEGAPPQPSMAGGIATKGQVVAS